MTQDKHLLSLSNIKFSWKANGQDVIDLEKLSISPLERVFIKGKSGSGKTTLLSLIGGINLPREGCIDILDTRMTDLTQSQRDQFRADHIGFIFQLFNLIPYLSVIDNITLACKFSALRASRALAISESLKVEAIRLLKQLQLFDETVLTKQVSELSVGQQQRVAAARALIGAPKLVIADEPTSALDADAQAHFMQLILDECSQREAALIFVSHDTQLASLFDRTIDLNEINQAMFQKDI